MRKTVSSGSPRTTNRRTRPRSAWWSERLEPRLARGGLPAIEVFAPVHDLGPRAQSVDVLLNTGLADGVEQLRPLGLALSHPRRRVRRLARQGLDDEVAALPRDHAAPLPHPQPERRAQDQRLLRQVPGRLEP